jgi:hypothetical protein
VPSRWVELINLSGGEAACSRKIYFSFFFIFHDSNSLACGNLKLSRLLSWEMTKKSAPGARAVISDTSVAGRSLAYQSSSLIDKDAIELCMTTSDLFVIDLVHRLKVRTPKLSTPLRRPEGV